MAKVYLLTDGCYSDFHVVGVFSTKARADEAMANLRARTDGRGGGDEDVEEYELDALVGFRRGPVYTATIEEESGEVHETGWGGQEGFRHPEAAAVSRPGGGRIYVTSPLSIDHATKVAIEKRQEWLRKRGMEPCG